MNDRFFLMGREYGSRVFHCFGHEDSKLNLDLSIELLRRSGTNFIIFNTHDINKISSKNELKIGFSSVTLENISSRINIDNYTLVNNINHALNAKEAIERAKKAVSISNNNIIKLEVLNRDLRTSNDIEVIKATKALVNMEYKVMPLCSCNQEVVKELEKAGCVMIRLIGSPIKSKKGLENKTVGKRIFNNTKIPVIVDGGIGNPYQVFEIMSLGASGVLVNTAIFTANNPLIFIEAIKHAVISGRMWFLENTR